MTSSLSFAQAGERCVTGSAAAAGAPAISVPAHPGIWARILRGLRLDRSAHAAAANAHRKAVEATLHRLGELAEGVAHEGHRSVDACTNLARQSKSLSDGLVKSEAEIDRIAQIAAENGTASQALQTEMKQTAAQLDVCVGQARNQAHLVEDLVRSVERSRTGFDEVNACVDEVERFLTIVHEIGSQAGLLALNAAIEASSAGQYGQGFFVVASEMRRLADKTAATIEQTRRMTERMRASTGTASELIATACLAAKPSRQRGEQMIEAIADCSNTVRQAESSAGKFTRASQQQIDAVGSMHTGLQVMRNAAFNCTFDADATAEMSTYTLKLSIGLYELLEKLGHDLKSDDAATDQRLVKYTSALANASARCRERAGFNELEQARPVIEAALRGLEQECLLRGPASRRGRQRETDSMPDLCFGGKSLNFSEEQVDSVQRLTGLDATILVRSDMPDESSTFYRVATSFTRGDGQRAVGTQLNPKGTVARKLQAGEAIFGYVYVLGLPYVSAYTPVRDVSGEVIGALCVGRALHGSAFKVANSTTQA